MANSRSHSTAEVTVLLDKLQSRIKKLERAVFSNRQKAVRVQDTDSFKGATGGLRLLVTRGFFNKKRAFGEIKEALANLDYHYSKQAIQTPLNALSKSGSLLVGFREGGKKVYAKRK